MSAATNQPDPRLQEFCDCFNRGEFFVAHEVLEELWLETQGTYRDLYKGLIQTAAVFVKLQQQKHGPAQRIAARAAAILRRYSSNAQGLPVNEATGLLDRVLRGENPLGEEPTPQLHLVLQ